MSATAAAAEDKDSFDSVRAQCPGLARIDLAALAAMPFDVDAARNALAAGALPELGNAEIVVRYSAPSGFRRAPPDAAILVARRLQGRWHYSRIRRPAGAEMRDHVLPADASRALDAALDDPCFAHEPDYAPRTMPLLGNSRETCLDGAIYLLQIERAAGVRTIRQDCVPHWHAGVIMQLLRDGVGAR